MKLSELKIDPEFESNNPKLTEAEKEQLEKNLLSDGVAFSPLIVWGTTIVDGHNRYRILLEHPEIQYSIRQMEFDNRHQAIAWICKNQLGRRNITLEHRKYLIAKQYEAEKAALGAADGFRGNQYQKSEVVNGQNGHLPNSITTREKIAKENNMSVGQVRHCLDYAKGVDAAEEIKPGIKDKLLTREIKPTAKDVAAVAKAAPEERKQLVDDLQKPKDKQKVPSDESTEKETVDLHLPVSKVAKPKPVDKDSLYDMTIEMEGALADMKWRWNKCLELYPEAANSREGKRKIIGLIRECRTFLKTIEKGEF